MIIRDERTTNDVRLCEVDFCAEFFIGEVLCKRVQEVGEEHVVGCEEDAIAVISLYSGQLSSFHRDTWVTPVKTELAIVD